MAADADGLHGVLARTVRHFNRLSAATTGSRAPASGWGLCLENDGRGEADDSDGDGDSGEERHGHLLLIIGYWLLHLLLGYWLLCRRNAAPNNK
jgi:hypothetical protein